MLLNNSSSSSGSRQHRGAPLSKRALIEQKERGIRQKEFNREDIVKQLAKDSVYKSYLECEENVDERRRLKGFQERTLEVETYTTLVRNAQEKYDLEVQRKKEEDLVQRLELIRSERLREQKLRQSIRENSVELRELEKKLNYAYMNKERALQLQEKSLLKEYSKVHDAELVLEMKKLSDAANSREDLKLKDAYDRSIDYQKALQGQLQELEEKKEEDLKQFMKDKAIVDAVVRQIQDEDDRDARLHMEKANETKKYIQEFMKEREAWKAEEAERKAAEDAKILEFTRAQQAREKDIAGKKAAAANARGAIYDKLASDMAMQERAKDELEQLRIELADEEQKEASLKKDRDILETRLRKRLELLDAYQLQVEDKRRRLEQEALEEDVFRTKMMKKFAEDERIEQMNQQRRRMKQAEHKRAVDMLVLEKKKLEEERLAELVHEKKRQEELESYRTEVIEQERQRLLREHASNLLGYLPKGVLRDEKDLELFDEDFRRRFGDLNV